MRPAAITIRAIPRCFPAHATALLPGCQCPPAECAGILINAYGKQPLTGRQTFSVQAMNKNIMSASDETVLRMKADWDSRAAENSRWYINTLSENQSEKEFDLSGLMEVQNQVVACLPLLTGGRNPKDLRLLEIGCGIGRMTRHLSSIFGEVHAVDVSAEMIHQAGERLRGLPNVHLTATNGCDFHHLPDERFDVIFSAYVFQHVPDAAIIAANLRDAWRILAPGGVFRFVVNARTDEEFVKLAKDTWAGASFPESELRHLALELKAQLMGISGEETQYCWSMWRKPLSRAEDDSLSATRPQILQCGWVDNLQNTSVPVAGERAYLTLLVAGLDRERADASNTTIQLGEYRILPRYLGAADPAYASLIRETHSTDFAEITQINLRVPTGIKTGACELFVCTANKTNSNVVRVTLI